MYSPGFREPCGCCLWKELARIVSGDGGGSVEQREDEDWCGVR